MMIPKSARITTILVVEQVQETREAIGVLLKHDGYRVDLAGNDTDAVERIRGNTPDLILISLGGAREDVLQAARSIRERGELPETTPVVIFSISMVPEGAEEEVSGNIHITAPDNFNQLRALLARILAGESGTQ